MSSALFWTPLFCDAVEQHPLYAELTSLDGNRDKRDQLAAIGPELVVSGSDSAVPLSQDPAKAREFLGRPRVAGANRGGQQMPLDRHCGDILRLTAKLGAGRVETIGYLTRGCTASIAVGSALTELLQGKTSIEALAITKEQVEEAVGGLSNESKHAALLAVDGVKAFAKAMDVSLA